MSHVLQSSYCGILRAKAKVLRDVITVQRYYRGGRTRDRLRKARKREKEERERRRIHDAVAKIQNMWRA
jgi:hypothetical protein